MVRAKIKGVFQTYKRLADGSRREYWYHRATGNRLSGKPGSPEFVRDLADAHRLQSAQKRGTFIGLIRDFTLSPEFGLRAESTQREYRRMLTTAEGAFGEMPIAALDDPRVRQDFMKWRDEIFRNSGPREADNRLSVISAMLTWGVKNGQITSNHVVGFDRLHKVNRSSMIWLAQHIAKFMEVAPVELQRAMILALHTGQRQGDLLRLTWTNYDGRYISLRQGKTGNRVEIPCTATLRQMLDGMHREALVILTTKTGMAWTPRYFKRRWQLASEMAEVDDLHFHDIRGTAVTMLSEAGCTVQEIATITGHRLRSVESILERYLSRTRTLADHAVAKFENAPSTEFANRLQTRAPNGAKGEAK